MDIQLKKKRLPNAKKAATVAIATIGIVGIAVWIWNSNKKTTTRIDRNAVTIATVEAGKFNDYIRIISDMMHPPAAPQESTSVSWPVPRWMPPMAYTGTGDIRQISFRKESPRGGTPFLQSVL